jgi:hypothetical protein
MLRSASLTSFALPPFPVLVFATLAFFACAAAVRSEVAHPPAADARGLTQYVIAIGAMELAGLQP